MLLGPPHHAKIKISLQIENSVTVQIIAALQN